MYAFNPNTTKPAHTFPELPSLNPAKRAKLFSLISTVMNSFRERIHENPDDDFAGGTALFFIELVRTLLDGAPTVEEFLDRDKSAIYTVLDSGDVLIDEFGKKGYFICPICHMQSEFDPCDDDCIKQLCIKEPAGCCPNCSHKTAPIREAFEEILKETISSNN